jgi:hypothetical protein
MSHPRRAFAYEARGSSFQHQDYEKAMKTLTAKSLFVLLTAFVASAAFAQTATKPQGGADKAPPSQAHVLTRSELDALLAKPEKLTIIDVRRPDELTAIGGFPVYLSIQLADLEKSLAWIKKAVDLLTSKGFKVAGAVGAQNYEEEGGKLTKITAPQQKVATVDQPATNK